ncbi:MAG: hypothetical protein ACE5GB_09295 [Acidimicrobiales bacterium]
MDPDAAGMTGQGSQVGALAGEHGAAGFGEGAQVAGMASQAPGQLFTDVAHLERPVDVGVMVSAQRLASQLGAHSIGAYSILEEL